MQRCRSRASGRFASCRLTCLSTSDGQTGSYRFVRRIGADKGPCGKWEPGFRPDCRQTGSKPPLRFENRLLRPTNIPLDEWPSSACTVPRGAPIESLLFWGNRARELIQRKSDSRNRHPRRILIEDTALRMARFCTGIAIPLSACELSCSDLPLPTCHSSPC
jgi:hypothetical protein